MFIVQKFDKTGVITVFAITQMIVVSGFCKLVIGYILYKKRRKFRRAGQTENAEKIDNYRSFSLWRGIKLLSDLRNL